MCFTFFKGRFTAAKEKALQKQLKKSSLVMTIAFTWIAIANITPLASECKQNFINGF